MKLGRALCSSSSHSRRFRFLPRYIGKRRPGQGFVQMNFRLYFSAFLDAQLVLEKVG